MQRFRPSSTRMIPTATHEVKSGVKWMFSEFSHLRSPTSDAKQKANLCSSKSMTSKFQYFIKIAYSTMVNQEYVKVVSPTPTPPQYAAQHSSDFKYPWSRTNRDVSKSSLQLKTRPSEISKLKKKQNFPTVFICSQINAGAPPTWQYH